MSLDITVTTDLERMLYGPNTNAVLSMFDRAMSFTEDEIRALAAADTADYHAFHAVGVPSHLVYMDACDETAERYRLQHAVRLAVASAPAYMETARRTLRPTAIEVVRYAAVALILRDHLDKDTYDILSHTWRTTVGPLHPDDQ